MLKLSGAIKTIKKDSIGVYKILDADFDIIYIGRSYNLKKRLLSSTGRFLLGEYVSFMLLDSKIEADLIEYSLIQKYNPRFNHPTNDPMSILKSYQSLNFTENFNDLILIDTPQKEKFAFCFFYKDSDTRKIKRKVFVDESFISEQDWNNVPKYLITQDV